MRGVAAQRKAAARGCENGLTGVRVEVAVQGDLVLKQA
jgi:hypothetical protein